MVKICLNNSLFPWPVHWLPLVPSPSKVLVSSLWYCAHDALRCHYDGYDRWRELLKWKVWIESFDLDDLGKDFMQHLLNIQGKWMKEYGRLVRSCLRINLVRLTGNDLWLRCFWWFDRGLVYHLSLLNLRYFIDLAVSVKCFLGFLNTFTNLKLFWMNKLLRFLNFY